MQEGDDRGEERRLIQERTDATRKAHMRRSELKKPANQKNHSGVVQRWADGDSSIFLFDLSCLFSFLLLPLICLLFLLS